MAQALEPRWLEQANQSIRHQLHRRDGRGALARVALEEEGSARITQGPPGAEDRGQSAGVAETELDALARVRMHAVRRVAGERQAMRDDRRQPQKVQRKTRARRDAVERSERMAAGASDACGKRLSIEAS